MVESYVLKTTIPKEDREFFSSHFRQIELSVNMVDNGYLFDESLQSVLNIGLDGARYCFMTVSNLAFEKYEKDEYNLLCDFERECRDLIKEGTTQQKQNGLYRMKRILKTYLITGVIIID